MSSEICLVVLLGLPGSGKSSLSKSLITDGGYSMCTITYDDHIMSSDVTENKYHLSRRKLLMRVDKFIESVCNNHEIELNASGFKMIQRGPELPTLAIIDDNNYYRSMRYNFYKLAKKYKTGFCQIYLKCDVDVCIERNKSRVESEVVPDEVIVKMFDKFEIPDDQKYKWESLSVILNGNETIKFNKLKTFEFIQKALKHPVFVSESLKTGPLQQSQIHKADLVLRKIVTSEINNYLSLNNNFESNVKQFASVLSKRKEHLLEQLKKGQLHIDETNDSEFVLRQLFLFSVDE